MFLPLFMISLKKIFGYVKPLLVIKNTYENLNEKKYKGNHIFADYKGLVGDEVEIGEFVYAIMQDAIIKTSSMKIVHKNLVILNEETQGSYTPPGFSGILQLDSSHFSAHSYTEEKEMGLLCVDIFTCSCNQTEKIIDYFEEKLKEKYPKVERVCIQEHKRFLY